MHGKYRAKARVIHPDKEGSTDLMQSLNASKEWLSTAENIRNVLVTFMNSEKSRREREIKKRAEEEQKARALARLEEYKKKKEEEENKKKIARVSPKDPPGSSSDMNQGRPLFKDEQGASKSAVSKSAVRKAGDSPVPKPKQQTIEESLAKSKGDSK